MLGTRRLLGLAIAGLAALAFLADAPEPRRIAPGDAAAWEGQTVTVTAVVRDARGNLDGGTRFDLVGGGAALAARLDPTVHADLADGDRVEVTGRLVRFNGVLSLLGEAVQGTPTDATTASVDLAALARDPAAWSHRPVHTRGVVDRGTLRADGHAIALGDGDWPATGPVAAEALLRYDATCACHRLDRVSAWTG